MTSCPSYPLRTGAIDRIPVVLAIDIEPDGRPAGADDPIVVDGFHATMEWLEELRPRLEAATAHPVRFAWFVRMDPQIAQLGGRADAVATAVMPQLMELRRRGDGIGIHTACRPVGCGESALARRPWRPGLGRALHPDRISRLPRNVRRAVPAASVRRPVDQRLHAFDLLAELGALVDLTEEPGKGRVERVDTSADATGEIPSYRHLHSEARPHRDPRLWLLPLFSADPGPALTLPIRVIRRVRFLGQPLHRPLTLDRPWRSPDAYWSVVERALQRQPAPYLASRDPQRLRAAPRPDRHARRARCPAVAAARLSAPLRRCRRGRRDAPRGAGGSSPRVTKVRSIGDGVWTTL